MSRDYVFSFLELHEGSVIPSVRMTRLIAETLELETVTYKNINDVKKIRRLVIVNGAYAFCKCLQELGALVEMADRVIWAQNDYTIIPPITNGEAQTPFRAAFRNRHQAGKPDIDYWTTVEDNVKLTKLSAYINWNCLTFDTEMTDKKVAERRKAAKRDLFYYGSFRAGRKVYFDRYFARSQVPVTVSSPAPKKFQDVYPGVTVIEKMQGSLSTELSLHGAGLYVEDKRSHKEFHSPANRFYEMLSAGLPMLFQQECGTTMRKAGYDPTPYVVDSPLSVKRALECAPAFGKKQREDWLGKARHAREELPSNIIEAWERLK